MTKIQAGKPVTMSFKEETVIANASGRHLPVKQENAARLKKKSKVTRRIRVTESMKRENPSSLPFQSAYRVKRTQFHGKIECGTG
ncbi:MAG: hypothetical protein JW881_20380 [Spirochaetales bacterium]|nr:hypothetical protein [Spirochaetales bacterium]